MRIAALSCEFLLGPALCDGSQIVHRVMDLIETTRIIGEVERFVWIEDHAIEKLARDGRFPSQALFQENFSRAGVDYYSARDVARWVHATIATAGCVSEIDPCWVADISNKNVGPIPGNPVSPRQDDIQGLVEGLILHKSLGNKSCAVVHWWDGGLLDHADVSFQGIVDAVLPEGLDCPHALSERVRFFQTLKAYISSLEPSNIYGRGDGEFRLKLALYAGTLARISARGGDAAGFSLASFDIGTRFAESMAANQAGPDQAFASVVIETAVGVLSGYPKYAVAPFATEAGGKVARKHGWYTAYRTHVTKGQVALRLMFWRDAAGHVVLANIGPKNELVIEPPGVN